MTIGEISDKTGLTIHTIRYYEKDGIIFPIKRGKGNIRCFSQTDLDLINYVICLKATGMPLDCIKGYINSCEYRQSCSKELILLLKKQKESVNKQIEELSKFNNKIDILVNYHSKKS